MKKINKIIMILTIGLILMMIVTARAEMVIDSNGSIIGMTTPEGKKFITPVGTLTAPYTPTPPVIDGSIDLSSEWVNANVYTDLINGHMIYLMHDGTNIYIAWNAPDDTHSTWPSTPDVRDHAIMFFDEGDDGANGSGSSDEILTDQQEDTKYLCSGEDSDPTPVKADGYCIGGGWTFNPGAVGPQYWNNGDWNFYGDHYEAEYAIPFQGIDGASGDVSDLVCIPEDISAIQFEYIEGHTSQISYSGWYKLVFDTPGPSNPEVEVLLNGDVFTGSDTITIDVHVTNGPKPVIVDAIVWVSLPDGTIIRLVDLSGFPLSPNMNEIFPILEHHFTCNEPLGLYDVGALLLFHPGGIVYDVKFFEKVPE